MNDLSGTAVGRRCLGPVPAAVPCVIVPLLLAGLAVSLLILVVVHNALLLGAVLLLSAVAASFLLWNATSFRNHGALRVFLDRLPVSDLVTARDGQLVKIAGVTWRKARSCYLFIYLFDGRVSWIACDLIRRQLLSLRFPVL